MDSYFLYYGLLCDFSGKKETNQSKAFDVDYDNSLSLNFLYIFSVCASSNPKWKRWDLKMTELINKLYILETLMAIGDKCVSSHSPF